MLKAQLHNDLKQAMKRGDAAVLSTLRMIVSAIKNKEIEKRMEALPDEDVLQVLATEARKRKESILSFEQAGRKELAQKEAAELVTIKAYLPEEASEADVVKAVEDAIAATGATGAKDMGKVMGVAMKALKGRADGTLVQKTVKEKLGA